MLIEKKNVFQFLAFLLGLMLFLFLTMSLFSVANAKNDSSLQETNSYEDSLIALSDFRSLNSLSTTSDSVNIYRFLNKVTAEHFYTLDTNEATTLKKQTKSWQHEGVAWKSPKSSKTIVYRFSNKYTGEHFFTLDKKEVSVLKKTKGMVFENIAWYASDSTTNVSIYRFLNKTTTEHFFTSDAGEMKALKKNKHFTYEGVAWYGCSSVAPTSTPAPAPDPEPDPTPDPSPDPDPTPDPEPEPTPDPDPVPDPDHTSDIQVGDYVKLGSYNGQSIIWRCVSIDENGPLMLSDKVLDTMPYDATTSKNSSTASHSRNHKRGTYGSNHWRDSNLRSWLNSSESAGNVEWLCGNPPDADHINGSEYAYDTKSGFLSEFSANDLSAIKTTEHRSIVSHPEYYSGYLDGAGDDLELNYDIQNVANGADGAYAENIIDKVFLMDVSQLNTVYKNFGDYYMAQNKDDMNWPYWLMTPVTDCNHDMRYVEAKGSISRISPNTGYLGVRPAFYLDAKYYHATSGDGSASNPYVGETSGKPEDSTQISGAERNTGDDNWNVDTDISLQLTLGTNYSSDGTYANTVVPVYEIQKPRSDKDNMVIVICADGYRKSQMAEFIEDTKRIWNETVQKEPYKSMKDYFNVYALCTPSASNFGSGNTFFDVTGTYDSATISNSNGQWKNHILERCIGPEFIEKVHDAHIENTTDHNNLPWDWYDDYAEYKPFYYVYEHISQFVVLCNSGTYFGGSNKEMKRGINYVVAPAKYSGASYVMTHELGHGIFNLGDEYIYSDTPVGSESDSLWLNASYTADPEKVKWKDMLGYNNTYSCPYYDGKYVYNSSRMCIMEFNTSSEFCDVCKLQAYKRASQLLNNVSTLYVATPEVKEMTGAYENLSDFSEASANGYYNYIYSRNSRLLSGSGASRFSSDMKGKKVELRTIVQNLSDSASRNVKLSMWVKRSDGSVATASDGSQLKTDTTYTIDKWDEKSKFYPKGYLEFSGTSFTSGLKNCTLTYTIPTNANIQSGDSIAYEVVDADTGEKLAACD